MALAKTQATPTEKSMSHNLLRSPEIDRANITDKFVRGTDCSSTYHLQFLTGNPPAAPTTADARSKGPHEDMSIRPQPPRSHAYLWASQKRRSLRTTWFFPLGGLSSTCGDEASNLRDMCFDIMIGWGLLPRALSHAVTQARDSLGSAKAGRARGQRYIRQSFPALDSAPSFVSNRHELRRFRRF